MAGSSAAAPLLILYAFSVVGTRATGFIHHVALAEILIPFCVMAIANGAIYPIVVAQALRPFPQATGRAAALQNTLQLGLCFGKPCRFSVDCYPAAHHHQRYADHGIAGCCRLQNASQKTDARNR